MFKPNNKVIVVGIDGATFKIIKPLIAEGHLPNISKLLKEGSHGVLWSVLPTVSPVAWTSFMTGKNPGRHGIYDFFGKLPNEQKFKINSALDRKAKPLWTILSETKKKVCIAGVTLTYPPDAVNGIMISGLGTPFNSECVFTHPDELSKEIIKELGEYRFLHKDRPVFETTKGKERYIRETEDLIDYRIRLYNYLLSKDNFDFSMLFYIDTDGTSHHFWKYMDQKDAKYGKVIFDIYERIDAAIGKLLETMDSGNTNIILMSDHGFGPLNRVVSLNTWLEQEGLLAFKRQNLGYRVKRMIRKVSSKFYGKVDIWQSDNYNSFTDDIDWEKTKAYFFGTVGNIFVNLEGREKLGIVKMDEYDDLRKNIASKLMKLTDPASGENMVEKVHFKEEVFKGEHLAAAPDIVVVFKPGYEVYTGQIDKIAKGAVISDSVMWSGVHEPDGIFVAHGPDFKKGAEISNAEIIDITPTVLYLLGIPIPEDMDGKVLVDAIDPVSLEKRKIKYSTQGTSNVIVDSQQAYNEDEAKNIEDHLRNLGYIE